MSPRGPDQHPRRMHPNSLANLTPAVQDGSQTFTTRLRLGRSDARTWQRMDPEERRRVVEMGLRVWEREG